MAVTVRTQPGDTWDAIAARELGNATLGAEIAGLNGYGGHQAVPIDAEITIPYRTDPPADASADDDAPAKGKGKGKGGGKDQG